VFPRLLPIFAAENSKQLHYEEDFHYNYSHATAFAGKR
jgi:hypothetical protein